MKLQAAPTVAKAGEPGFVTLLFLLLAILALLLHGDFVPGNLLVSNDGPLGRLMAECHRLPERFTGCWEDLNSLGVRNWGAAPGISFGLQWLLGPVVFSKLYVPIALLILGCGAWCFFRQSGLAAPACLLGGVAAMLHSTFFSGACWGVASHPITAGMVFFALAALVNPSPAQRWLRVALAGFAVGMAVSEGADIGAIYSLYVALFVIYQAWMTDGPRGKNLSLGLVRVALLAVCAGLLAAQAIAGLLAADVNDVNTGKHGRQTKAEHWDWATQWSFSKKEVLSLVVPGLFGYLDQTPDGGAYWGSVGRAPAWDRYVESGSEGPPPTGFKRFSGGGPYTGVAVILVACWAATQALRRNVSIFSRTQRRWLWFWLGVSLVSLLLALGRFAPFYRLIYALPYFSTIRNPTKFISVFSVAVVVLFAYGVDGLWRGYMQTAGRSVAQRWMGFRSWWARATQFERNWVCGCLAILGLSLLAWLIYASCRESLVRYLQSIQVAENHAAAIAGFSIWQVGWFVLFFIGSAGWLALVLSGAFAGKGARSGWLLLGCLLVADLARANQPWIRYIDYQMLYVSNPIIDKLREKPYEQRVALLPFQFPPRYSLITQLYQNAWSAHLFPYYNIQTIEDGPLNRLPTDIDAFQNSFNATNEVELSREILRFWQLTSTRYLIAPAGALAVLNGRIDPAHHEFRIAERFDIVPKPGVDTVTQISQLTAEPAEAGLYALFEFTGALPRAKLYCSWQVVTNNQTALDEIIRPAFDPEQTVFLTGGSPLPAAAASSGQNPGTVVFSSYAPKHIVLKSEAPAPSVLLLNDHYDPNWHVRVDGKPEALLRCNYVMRGVYLTPGPHTIDFRFQPPIAPLYVSLAAIAVGLVVLAYVGFAGAGKQVSLPTPATAPALSKDHPAPVAAAQSGPTASPTRPVPPRSHQKTSTR